MHCPFCRKAIRLSDKDCPYCGNPIPSESDLEDLKPSEWLEQIMQVKEHLSYKPSPVMACIGLIALSTVGFLLMVFCTWFIPGELIIFKIVLIIFALLGVMMVVGGVWGLVKVATSRFARVPALVVGMREHHLSDDDSSVSYYLTIKTEDGQTKEHAVRRKLFAKLKTGDVGVAYFKGYLMDFKPVALPQEKVLPKQ